MYLKPSLQTSSQIFVKEEEEKQKAWLTNRFDHGVVILIQRPLSCVSAAAYLKSMFSFNFSHHAIYFSYQRKDSTTKRLKSHVSFNLPIRLVETE